MGLRSSYLFLLGLSAGLTLLAMSSYRRVSPRWLRLTLLSAGLLVIGRYVALFLFTSPEAPNRFLAFGHLWFGTSIGLTLPSVFAIDQLLRHPAMTPAKLLRWFSPFCAVYLAVILFAGYGLAQDPVGGWAVRLAAPWRIAVSIVQTVFVCGFVAICGFFIGKPISKPARIALLLLALAHAYMGFDGLLLLLNRTYFRPFLFSEMATLLALWYSYEISYDLQHSPNT